MVDCLQVNVLRGGLPYEKDFYVVDKNGTLWEWSAGNAVLAREMIVIIGAVCCAILGWWLGMLFVVQEWVGGYLRKKVTWPAGWIKFPRFFGLIAEGIVLGWISSFALNRFVQWVTGQGAVELIVFDAVLSGVVLGAVGEVFLAKFWRR
jgi:hypothetical protein